MARFKGDCITVDVAGSYPVTLAQTGVDRFSVTYGKQIKSGLDYGSAAMELGSCIMHALACASRLDSRKQGERY